MRKQSPENVGPGSTRVIQERDALFADGALLLDCTRKLLAALGHCGKQRRRRDQPRNAKAWHFLAMRHECWALRSPASDYPRRSQGFTQSAGRFQSRIPRKSCQDCQEIPLALPLAHRLLRPSKGSGKPPDGFWLELPKKCPSWNLKVYNFLYSTSSISLAPKLSWILWRASPLALGHAHTLIPLCAAIRSTESGFDPNDTPPWRLRHQKPSSRRLPASTPSRTRLPHPAQRPAHLTTRPTPSPSTTT